MALCVAGCGYFPRSGPTADAIEHQAQFASLAGTPQLNYVLIQLEPRLFPALSSDTGRGFGFTSHPPPADIRPGIGDVLSVTIFEAGPGGLFTPPESTRGGGEGAAAWTELPPQTVDRNGEILIPYGGKVRVAGRSLAAIEQDIADKIKNRAIQPEVLVNIREQRASLVSVLGQVNRATTIPLPEGGLRILQAISLAGGLSVPGYDAAVTLQRKGRSQTVAFDKIVYSANNNIFLEPGDVVYVAREPRSFIALGALGSGTDESQGRIEFESETISLMDAIGKARGLLDSRAKPADAFVFRLERRDLLEKLGYPVEQYGPLVPTIYKMDFSDPSSYFLADNFRVRNKDILYVANAPSADMTKFLTYVGLITTPVSQGIGDWGIIHGILSGAGTIVVPTVTTTSP